MITGIFARADHPEGYGFGEKAHGYSVLFVICEDQAELREIVDLLTISGIGEPMQQTQTWYGGKFDLLAVTQEGIVLCPYDLQRLGAGGECRISMGDNRFVGQLTAADIRDLKVTP